MKLDWQFSLYDFFGFLVPGAVLLTALALAYWGLFLPDSILEVRALLIEGWVFVLTLSYICGHLAQGITNHISPWLQTDFKLENGPTKGWRMGDLPTIDRKAVDEAKKRMESIVGKEWASTLDGDTLCTVCEHYLVQAGSTGDREIFQYRRGFYRGMSFSSTFLVAAILLRGLIRAPILRLSILEHRVTPLEVCFIAAFFLIVAVISWSRQQRFVMYIRQAAIYGFLTHVNSSENSRLHRDHSRQASDDQ